MLFSRKIFGSDAPRSMRQCLRRIIAQWVARPLNYPTPFATEIVQAIRPTIEVKTVHGSFLCRAGHGRLVWRAETFHTEEPDTVAWLDTLKPDHVLWDVGANVGIYSLYAAKFKKCKVVAFEPEGQNYALLMDNKELNGLDFTACNTALSDVSRYGAMNVRYITKGGAFNSFEHSPTVEVQRGRLEQFIYASSGDDLVFRHGFAKPTHVKIDVDGTESKIINGMGRILESVQSVLIELNMDSSEDRKIPAAMAALGFWRVAYPGLKKTTKRLSPMHNFIFERGPA